MFAEMTGWARTYAEIPAVRFLLPFVMWKHRLPVIECVAERCSVFIVRSRFRPL